MKNLNILSLLFLALLLSNCSSHKIEKGFSVSPETQMNDEKKMDGIYKDSLNFDTRPGSVLLTGFPEYRLTTIFKLNYDKKEDSYYIGTNNYYNSYYEEYPRGNQWNNNFMPGLDAVYGLNIVNVSLFNNETKKQNLLFEKPVLVKTVYYPSFSNDTLNFKPVKRDYYLISVYDEDTNNDGFINLKDLRRFYTFDINGLNKTELIPKNYSVISSQYDPANDYMYVFAQVDSNKNGQGEEPEDIQIFWIDLKNPRNNGHQY